MREFNFETIMICSKSLINIEYNVINVNSFIFPLLSLFYDQGVSLGIFQDMTVALKNIVTKQICMMYNHLQRFVAA